METFKATLKWVFRVGFGVGFLVCLSLHCACAPFRLHFTHDGTIGGSPPADPHFDQPQE